MGILINWLKSFHAEIQILLWPWVSPAAVSISLLLSLEFGFWNSILHFLLSLLSFTLKQLQPKVTNSLLKCHLFSKTFLNPSIYNNNLFQFKIASCFTAVYSHPLSWCICLHGTYQLLTHHAIHFSMLSFASSNENVNSTRAGIFVYLVSANKSTCNSDLNLQNLWDI